MSAEGQIKAFIDRILRLKEEQDVIGDDIRDIYAEAKGMGFDKTAMGNVVAHLRKVAKKGSETVAEQGAIFDIYLAAYEGHAPAPARVRENIEKFDPQTGEILGDVDPKLAHTIVTGLQTESGRAALTTALDIMIAREEADEGFQAKASDDNGATGLSGKVTADRVTGDASRPSRGGDTPASIPEIASASQGEAEVHSDQRETDREAAATGVGANEGGDNVESSAERAGLEGGPVNLEPSGPEAEWAPNKPETATKSGADTDPGETAAEGICEAVTAGETATQFHAKASDDACEAGRKALGRAEASADAPDGAELVSRGVGDRAPTATSEEMDATAGETAPSFLTKAPSPLRPHCQRTEMCAGVGRTHCHTCTKAMREQEEFA